MITQPKDKRYTRTNPATERRKKKYVNPYYNAEDIYDAMKRELHPDFHIDKKLYKDILYELNKEIADLVINKSKIIKLPYNLGEFYVGIKKMYFSLEKSLRIDYGHLKKTGEKRYHTNIHSDFWRARFVWSRKKTKVKNAEFYSFTATQTNRWGIAKNMLEEDGYKKYLEQV